jgi:hypothetical protein
MCFPMIGKWEATWGRRADGEFRLVEYIHTFRSVKIVFRAPPLLFRQENARSVPR